MTATDAHGDDSVVSKLALHALCASVHDAPAEPLGYVILPDKRPVGAAQAIAWLASFEKPCLCWASRFQRGIVIACWARSQVPPSNRFAQRLVARANRFLEHLTRRVGIHDVRVAVDRTNPRLDLTGSQLRRFLLDYDVAFGAMSTRRPDEALKRDGIDMILDLGALSTALSSLY